MNIKIDIDPKLSSRIDALAARLGTSPSEIVRDALEHGRSVAWQEEWLRRIEAGIAAADSGDFGDDDDIAALLARHR